MAANTVDSLLVPGMMEMKVPEALSKLESLCGEMREAAMLCKPLVTRLCFLHDHPEAIMAMKIPAQYADMVGATIKFFKKHSSKHLLHRIAASRRILSELRDIHQKIDVLFNELQLRNSSEMTTWKDSWAGDLHKQSERFLNNLSSYQLPSDPSTLEEAAAVLEYEVERMAVANSAEHVEVIKRALAICSSSGPHSLPADFVLRDDVELRAELFEEGSFGQLFKGDWVAPEGPVAVKRFFLDSSSVQAEFRREIEISSRLHHQHVLKFHGACHVGNPVFTVHEFAANSNFAAYFETQAHRTKFWQLFLEAAQGLLYLHSHGVVHGNVRCNNLLVGSDHKARVSNAGFNEIRRMSIGRSLNGGINSIRWMAPECLLKQGVEAEPSFVSDAYSFGMAIIEAKTSKHPWPNQETDEDVIDALVESGYKRPEEYFTVRVGDCHSIVSV